MGLKVSHTDILNACATIVAARVSTQEYEASRKADVNADKYVARTAVNLVNEVLSELIDTVATDEELANR